MTPAKAAALLAGVSLLALAAPAFAAKASSNASSAPQPVAQPNDDRVKALEEQVQGLQDQIIDLKRSTGDQYTDITNQQNALVKVTIANGRPTFTTADGQFSASLRATVQFDWAGYFQDPGKTVTLTPALGRELSSGTNFRRAQFGLDGTVFKNWTYSFIYDFGGSNGAEQQGRVSSAYVQYNGFAPFQIRVGAFAPYIGLEDSSSAADTLFAERSSASELSRNNTGGDGRSAIQIAAVGDDYLAAISYSGSAATTAASFDEQQAINARFAYLLYSDLDTKIVGSLSGVYEFQPPHSVAGAVGATNITLADRPELRVDGTQLINATLDADDLIIGGGELGAVWKNLYAQGGWFNYHVDRRASAFSNPDFSAWYLQAAWVLTGETRVYDASRAAFRNPKPDHPFGLGDGIGAWELAARYSTADLNYDAALAPAAGGIRGGEQKIATAGVHWYPNNVVKVLFDYQHVEINKLNGSAIAAAAPYPAVAAGAPIGQAYNTVNLRVQIAF
ncbi:phosphate-selective porin OprO/OprP [Rhizomicrobium palustre]|uniref:Phosphate-selective porin OprO/OprP n=1 Tax=Rhizomicrobium palustre TaxID=189966 RepID=A0A846N1B5_9PROT|nr:porin [Rhizomicrobium palustre]NIK89255.1 phosphate-selective porin OprO/OprP [Rhizomicrobium palustre]